MNELTDKAFFSIPRKTIEFIAEECVKIIDKKKTIDPKKETKTYTTAQVATLLHRSKTTIQRHCEKGILPATKPGKSWIVTEDGLNEYLKKN